MVSKTTQVATMALCAALYAVAKAITAFVPTPWGVGQFAPGVVVPAFFAVVSGPYVAALGAGIGVFVGDLYLTTFGLTNPLLSLIAGVPGNLVGFFLLGKLMEKWRSWNAFIWASLIAIFAGNLVAATGVVGYLSLFLPETWGVLPWEVQVATTLGFTLFWMATMLPFVIPIVPLLVRAATSVAGRTSAVAGIQSWQPSRPSQLVPASVAVAVLFGVAFFIVMFTSFGDLMFSQIVRPEHIGLVKTLTLVTAITMLVFGPLIPVLASHGS